MIYLSDDGANLHMNTHVVVWVEKFMASLHKPVIETGVEY